MENSQKLKDAFEEFKPKNTVEGLTEQFAEIAKIVFNGRFVVNGEYEIHPIDIEFYFNSEEKGGVKEPRMYHKGNLPYFQTGSLYPHKSGVDMTFEKKGKYRASFLIRGYKYKSLVDENEKEYINCESPQKPTKFFSTYLREDLFGNASVFGENGLSVVWRDNDEFKDIKIQSSARVNIGIVDGEKTHRLWRFTKPVEYVYFSEHLETDYRDLYNNIIQILSKYNICNNILKVLVQGLYARAGLRKFFCAIQISSRLFGWEKARI